MMSRCVSKRGELLIRFRERYSHLTKLMPSQIVADVIRDVCHYGIEDWPLPKGQEALCNYRLRRIRLNNRRVRGESDQAETARKRSALAHELGHMQLHPDEMEELTYISSNDLSQGFDDSRFFNKEFEADFFAAVWLVPMTLLRKSNLGRSLRQRFENGEKLKSEQLWAFVDRLAERFGVTRKVMRHALEIYAWVDFRPRRQGSDEGELTLVMAEWCD